MWRSSHKKAIGFALKLPTLKQGQELKCYGVDFDQTYRISRVHGTYHLYQEWIKSDQ